MLLTPTRHLRRFMIAALLLAITSSLASAASTQSRPNIIIMLADDHAIKALSAYGNSLVNTPNIDRIAKNGMRFDRAYVGNAICGPSRATLLTGMHSHGNAYYSNDWSGKFNGRQQSLPFLLNNAGYQTAVIGKWHLFSDPVGFDHWEIISNVFEQGSYYNPEFRTVDGTHTTDGYVAEIVTDKAIDWIAETQKQSSPFFLLYSHKSPHRDWQPGPDELRNWDEQHTIAEPPSLHRTFEASAPLRKNADMHLHSLTDRDLKLQPPRELTQTQLSLWEQAFADGNRLYARKTLSPQQNLSWKYQRYIKSYLAAISSMDREVGRLLDALNAQGIADNTVIIYTSDQGFFLGENGWFDKRWIDEVSSRVPLLVSWPAVISANSHSSALVQNIDIAPTLLDIAGISPAKPMHGRSLQALFEKPHQDWPRDLYYHYYENPGWHNVPRHYGIISQRYKLVHYYQANLWELYDLQEDPGEQRNRYGDPVFESTQEDLKKRLSQLRSDYDVPEQDPEIAWYYPLILTTLQFLMRFY